jgi:hypothetical protein
MDISRPEFAQARRRKRLMIGAVVGILFAVAA